MLFRSVKVDGSEPSTAKDGVLFSAHFDSVSTGYGATDDGMAIVTLLQLIEYFSILERRPRRTAVFLLNNGEEDGLNGAHLYYEHPWSNLTGTFVNLEGAGAGGYVSVLTDIVLVLTRQMVLQSPAFVPLYWPRPCERVSRG